MKNRKYSISTNNSINLNENNENYNIEEHCRFCNNKLNNNLLNNKGELYYKGDNINENEETKEITPRNKLSFDRDARKNLISNIVGALGDTGLSVLRIRFEEMKIAGGLDLPDFIQLLLSQLPSIEELQKESQNGHPRDENELIITLTELFTNIKGIHGRLSWSEFTAYITDHIIVPETATVNLSEADLIPPYRKSLFSQAQRHLHQVQKICYCQNIDALAVLEKGVKYIKLYNTNTSQVIATLTGNRGIPMSCDYINSKYLLATGCANNTIAIWDCNAGLTQYQIAEKPAGTPLRWLTEDVQTSMCYSEKLDRLYSGSAEGKLHIWNINEREEIGQLKNTNNKPAHEDMIVDLKFIDSLDNLLCCSMDHTIGLWDVYTGNRRQVYKGHRKGVLSVDYIESLQIVVSAGFDRDIFLWGPFTGQLIKRLSGHMSPLTGVYHVPNTNELISADSNGIYKIWDIRTFECVQTFYDEAGSGLNGQLTSFTYDTKHHRIFGSCRRLQIYEQKAQDRTRYTHVSAVSAALYDPYSLTFVTCASTIVKVWDALTGKLRHMYKDVVNSDISYLCLSPSGKKIFIGCNNGTIKAFSYPVISYIKDMAPHKAEVTAIYYVEKDTSILTTSWDRIITVQDDSTSDRGVVTRVFSLDLGHVDDITHCIFDYSKDLVVTGSPDCSSIFIYIL